MTDTVKYTLEESKASQGKDADNLRQAQDNI